MRLPAKLWEWEGEQLTAQQISAKAPIYSGVWVRKALKDGATCIADLHQKHAEGLARRKAGGAKGGDRTSWRKDRACMARLYDFEGERMSAAEIQRRAEKYSLSSIERYLMDGAKTLAELDKCFELGQQKMAQGRANGREALRRKSARARSTTRAG